MAAQREHHYRWSWLLPADAEALWPLVSDTDRFNRDAGLPPVEDALGPERLADRLVLKAGVHYGPCVCVTLNDRLDYFGTTMNVAARLGSLSAGDDVVISSGVRRTAAVESLLAEEGVSLNSLTTEIRGLENRLVVWRVPRPHPTPETA